MPGRHRCGTRRIVELDWLKDFLALAELRNFSRAAERRCVTQPAFSRRIRALEEWIGAALFERGAQGASLTPAGAHFRPLAEDLARRLEQGRREAQAIAENRADALTIAATHALSFSFFPGWIRRRLSLDAIGALNLVSDSLAGCERAMLGGEADFLLCHRHEAAPVRLDPRRFPGVRLGRDALAPLCAPDGAGRPLWPIPGAAEAGTRLLGYSEESGLGRIVAAQREHAPELRGVEPVFTAHLAATLSTMARDGQGVAWLPLTFVEEDLAAGRLVRAGAAALDIPIEIALFRAPDRRSRAADRLWESLVEEAGEGP